MKKKSKYKSNRNRQLSYDGASQREVSLKDNMHEVDYRGYLYDCANSEYDQDNW